MTEDFERRAHAAASRVNNEAAVLAERTRPSDVRAGMMASPRRSSWLAVAAVALVVVGGASLLMIASAREVDAPAGTHTATVPASSAVTDVASTASSVSPTSAPVPPSTSTAAPAVVVPDDVPLVAFEEGTCESQHVAWVEPDGPSPWYAFARGRVLGVPVQVIADRSEGAAGPFAVILRYFEPHRPAAGQTSTEIGGNQVFVSVYDRLDGSDGSGNGEAVWDLPDGSQGYLRSRGLDSDVIESIVADLRPRSNDHPIPGFDYQPDESRPEPLELVAEQTNDEVFSAIYALHCVADNSQHGWLVTPVVVVADQGVAPYGAAIDRHRPAWITRDADAVYIGGIEPRADAPAEALTTISPADWRTLWSPNTELATTPNVAPGDTLAVRIGAIGQPSEATTSVSLSRRDDDWLHLDFTDTALDPSAATIEIRVNGELIVGSSAPATSIEVASGRSGSGRTTIDIRVLDVDGNVVQQSGPTSLPPIIEPL